MAIDTRFYQAAGPVSAADLAAVAGAVVDGDGDRCIDTLSSLEYAGDGALSFLDDGVEAVVSAPSACFSSEANASALPRSVTRLLTPFPRSAFAKAAGRLVSEIAWDSGEPPKIHPEASLEEGVRIGAGACIGAGVRIGANSVIGPGVQIGRDCYIGTHVSIRFALIGDRVRLRAGVKIGEDGFGLATDSSGPVDLPHFGRVIVQDDATIGANSCVDRGFLDDTVIGEGAKIDNLCQIAHNARVGRGAVIAAFGGVSGSAVIGDHARFGGRVGLVDHVSIGAGASIAAGSCVFGDVPEGETWGGAPPARPLRQWARETTWLRRNSKKAPAKDE